MLLFVIGFSLLLTSCKKDEGGEETVGITAAYIVNKASGSSSSVSTISSTTYNKADYIVLVLLTDGSQAEADTYEFPDVLDSAGEKEVPYSYRDLSGIVRFTALVTGGGTPGDGVVEAPNEQQVNSDEFTAVLINGGKEYKITKYDGTNTVVTVPSEINGKPVTSIGVVEKDKNLHVFKYYRFVTELTLPSTLKEIDDEAFLNMVSLTSLTVPEGVTRISYQAFAGCTELKTITLPSTLERIEIRAFTNCKKLNGVTLPQNLVLIDEEAFSNCISLTSIVIPNKLGTVDVKPKGIYDDELGINHGVGYDALGQKAFEGCTKLASITLSENITILHKYTFNKCTALTSIVIPENVESFSDGLFYQAASLSSITFLGDKIKVIPEFAFHRTGFVTFTLPENIVKVDDRAFYGTTTLETFVLNVKLEEIALEAFLGCSSLTQFVANDNENGFFTLNGALYQNNTLAAYPAAKTDETYTNPAGITEIGIAAFEDSQFLKHVTLTASVTTVNDKAFLNASALETVNILGAITSLNAQIFEKCAKLTSVSFPTSVKEVRMRAFSGCTALKAVALHEGITYIGGLAFENSGIETLTIPESVTEIGAYAFKGCDSLTGIYFPYPEGEGRAPLLGLGFPYEKSVWAN
ncbi:MAG: leucine-rich repeat domain-containing protein [Christensenellaceae bacterium]|nr:leucine-rich repeat domain-containing protein [Christensenellaceae bacterium]